MKSVHVTPAGTVDITDLLKQLYWHHVSQSKGAVPCTQGYHREVAVKIGNILGMPRLRRTGG